MMKKTTIQIQVVGIALLLLFALKGEAQSVQYSTINILPTNAGASTNLAVQTNQLVSVVGYDWNGRPAITGFLANGTSINLTPYTYVVEVTSLLSSIPQSATGLTSVAISGDGGGFATFQITTPISGGVVSNYVPADAIVIPSSATGNVQIILESSPDLMNWTAANPGIYGPSAATNRFFRVRAVVQ
jgi:hypothetical protein